MLLDLESMNIVKQKVIGRICAFNRSKESNKNLYAVTRIGDKLHYIHRLIYPDSEAVDHINHNGLDNRMCNIRPCTKKQNSYNCSISKNNTSGVTGVRKKEKKWQARIMVNRKEICLGSYENKTDAINARQEAEKKYFGEFRNDK